MRSPNWLACLGPLSLFATTLACNPDPTPNPNVTADGGAAALASINLVNLAYVTKLSGKDVVDVSMVDLYIDKQKATPALDYRKSSGNLKITPSVHTVELRAVGDDPSAPALLTATIDLLPGSRTLLAAIGRSADTDGPSRLQLVAAPLGTTDAASVKVRMFNATPEAPALDLAAGNNSVAGNAAYASASSYGSVALLPAATKLGLRLTRTTTDLAYVTLPAMATPGSVLTVLTLGELNPTADSKHFLGASVLDEGSGSVIDLPLVINDAGPKGSLYVIHASPDAPALDVVNAQGTKIITNVAYRQASALGELAAGQTAVDLRPTGTSATTLALQLKILPTLSWAVVAHGSIALGTSTKFEVTVMPRPLAPQTGWRLVHAVSDVAAFAVAASKPLLARVAYGQSSSILGTALPAPTLTLQLVGVTPKQGWDINVPQMVQDVAQGQLVTVVATGTVNNAMQPFGVLAVLDSTATTSMAPTVMTLMVSPATMVRAVLARP